MGAVRPTGTFSLATSPPQSSMSPPAGLALSGHGAHYFIEAGEALIGVTCMLLVLCMAAVAGRLAARRMTRAALQADDYISLLALVSRTFRQKRS